MYKEKGLIKVFNGKKFKIVTYHNEKGLITFATSSKSHKYDELTKSNKIKVEFDGKVKKYHPTLIEDPTTVDQLFSGLKKNRTIPFFIPRKNKIIVQYHY